MIIVVKQKHDQKQLDRLIEWVKAQGLDVDLSVGSHSTVLGLIGDTSRIDIDLVNALDIVESVKRIQEPFKCANRKFHPEDTIIKVGDAVFGGGNFVLVAGPCSVENENQIISIAKEVKKSGATVLRGGAFKPRTSPYSFQGLKGSGIELLLKAKAETGLPIVTEVMSVSQLDLFTDVDIIQIGARNMQNFELLKEVGKLRKPVLLKRGLANTIEEWLMSAEYIMSEGNKEIILCERGIRTFETATRNTLDLSAVPVLRELTHLPVIIDPSHASGFARLVPPLSMAAAGVGADGLIIEVHNDPKHALCDGAQSITPEQFDALAKKVNAILPFVDKTQIKGI